MQIVCWVKVRHGPTKHDYADFKPIVIKISEIKKLSAVVADKGYDSEDSHLLVRQKLGGYIVIPARNEQVPIWKTFGRYRKKMKREIQQVVIPSEKQG